MFLNAFFLEIILILDEKEEMVLKKTRNNMKNVFFMLFFILIISFFIFASFYSGGFKKTSSYAVVSSSPQCSDGLDNDLDGFYDLEDAGCSGGSDAEEFDAPPAPTGEIKAGGLLWYPNYNRLGPNLLKNPGFEEIDASTGKPSNWSDNGFAVDSSISRTGSNSYKITDANKIKYSQYAWQYVPLKKGTYRVAGWIKTDSIANSTGFGVRISGGGATTKPTKGTHDWQYFEAKHGVLTENKTGRVNLDSYGDPDGTAWFDDIELREELPLPIDVFMLYPNYRGMLFDDQSQIMKFDITINPPSGTALADYSVEILIIDESNNKVVIQKNYPSKENFIASIDGSSLENGKTYIARFKLMDVSRKIFLYEAPAYRISKLSGSLRNSMTVSFDEFNRFLIRGKPTFILGVYDSGMGYSASESSWENSLFGKRRRLFELPINFYINYWYGNAALSSMTSMMNVLQKKGILYLQTGNCFGDNGWGAPTFLINKDDDYLKNLSAHPGLGGFYTMDECTAEYAPMIFEQYKRLRSFDPDGVTFAASMRPNQMFYWRDSADILSMDPYPLSRGEPYNLSKVSHWTIAAKESVKGSRPINTVLQFFQSTSKDRWPTEKELRDMSYMAIAEGANGLWYWSIGAGALAWVGGCNSSEKDENGWCPERIDYFNRLKNVMNEIKGLEPALVEIDMPELLAGNTNPMVRTRVKFAEGKGYLIASNIKNSDVSATFTWKEPLEGVLVYNESRELEVSGNSFSDSFKPYEAHVYILFTKSSPVSFYIDWSEWDNETTNFSKIPREQLKNIKNVRFSNNYGKIEFMESLSLVKSRDLRGKIKITKNRILLNSSFLPEFNKKARLVFKNVDMENPVIKRDGSDCPETICTDIVFDPEAKTLSFNVTSFSIYEVVEQCEDGIQNYDETGIDCGGSCRACSSLPESRSSGGGSGGGSSSGGAPVSISGKEVVAINAFPDRINLDAELGEILEQKITLTNTGDATLEVSIAYENLEGILSFSPKSFLLKPEESKELNFSIFSPEREDIYTGKILFGFRSQILEIPFALNVKSKEIPVNVSIDIPDLRILNKKDNLTVEISFFGDGIDFNDKLSVEYVIMDFSGRTYFKEREDVVLSDEGSYLKTFQMENLSTGKYVVGIKARSGGKTITASSQFSVISERVFMWGIVSLITLLIFSTLAALIWRLKKHLENTQVGNRPPSVFPRRNLGRQKVLTFN